MSFSPLRAQNAFDPRVALTTTLVPDAAATELLQILDQHLEDLKAGRGAPRAELIERYPHLASQLDACLAGLEFIHDADASLPSCHQRLGDFRIIREVGRGGMGAVYEAEQISLRRIVALKIMRFGNVADPEAIERFKREAETVAAFHHTNIVPIFAVGVDRGVNYYAMQFIEGRSLAQVLSDGASDFDCVQVAEWGLQACEALSHAHQRGVVHRDVKPSNLLVDRENRLWLTDFGLARKLDNVTLSVAGALVGTPRYMSPEQATAAIKLVDHRSDIFSLGATLYELLTGVPAFRGDTPIEVIQNILAADPDSVRKLAPSTPRDLETIVMKCLSKEPHQRYDSAQDLCSDLRAFIDGRPIRARRANVIERGARWLHRQQSSVKLAASVAAITVATTIAAIAGWFAYDAARQGSLQLNAATPPLVVEVIDQQGDVVQTETAPMQNAMHLTAGDYEVRASSEGELSESYRVSLSAGEDLRFTLDPHDQLLWNRRNIDGRFDVFPANGASNIVTWSKERLAIWKHFPPQTITTPLGAASLPDSAQAPGFVWPGNTVGADRSGYGHYNLGPWVGQKPVDVDHDGTTDLIIAGRHQAWLAAISGHNGSVLWIAPRGRDVTNGAARVDNLSELPVTSAVLSELILDQDIDADGVADIVTTMAEVAPGADPNAIRPSVNCWVEAISSKTGQALWRFDIPLDCFALDAGEKIPYELRWYVGRASGSFGGNNGSGSFGRHRVRFGGWKFERHGPHGYRPASVTSITVHGMRRLAVVAGKSLVLIDPETGERTGPVFDLGVRPGQACQWGDVDGDGIADLIMLEEKPDSVPESAPRLAAWSTGKQKLLWSKTIESSFPRVPDWSIAAPRWPLVADLDGDGKCEVMVPDGRSSDSAAAGVRSVAEIPWGSLSVINGATAETRWSKRLVTMDRQIGHFLDGPDIDQDGCREVFAATLVGNEFRVHVDALSGRTGETLWTNSFAPASDTNSSVEYHLTPPKWWHSGKNAWPQLIVHAVEGGDGQPRSLAAVISVADGKLERIGRNITAMHPSDVDGDGVEDLLVFNAKSRRDPDFGGSLHCIRGVAAESWSQLGDRGDPVSDMDGDGVRDLVSGWPSDVLAATSGSTGKLLWSTTLGEDGRKYQIRAASANQSGAGDLDGDGVGDLLGWSHVTNYREFGHPFFALSGKTGKRLWIAEDITAQILHRVLTAETHDIDGDGKLEVIWIASLDHGNQLRNNISTNDAQLWMFVCSGQTGALQWATPLSAAYGGTTANVLAQIAFEEKPLSAVAADIDGDGVKDFLVPNILDDGRGLETTVRSGINGTVLWSRPFPIAQNQQVSLTQWTPPAVCDLNGDGRVEVIAVEPCFVIPHGTPVSSRRVVTALDGKTGTEFWNSSVDTSSALGNATVSRSGEFWRARALRAEGNTFRFAVLTSGPKPVISVFDAKGVRQEWGLSGSLSFAEMWVCDADQDGIDEIVYLDQRTLSLISTCEPMRSIWSLTLPAMGPCRIVDIRKTFASPTPTIAVAFDASDNSVIGLNAATGERIWSAAGIISRSEQDGTLFVPRRIDWLDTHENKSAFNAPFIYCNYAGVSRVRRGVSQDLALGSLNTGSVRVVPQPLGAHAIPNRPQVDVRWYRELPWARESISVLELGWNIVWLLLLALCMIVLPIAFVFRIVRRRQYGLNTLLCLPVIAGFFLASVLIDIPIAEDVHTMSERLSFAAAFAPLVLAIGVMSSWATSGRWRRLLAWLVGTIFVSGLCAVVMLWIDAYHSHPLLPEEFYSLHDWPFIWLIGAYVTAWLLMISLPCESAIVWLRKRTGQARRSLEGDQAIVLNS